MKNIIIVLKVLMMHFMYGLGTLTIKKKKNVDFFNAILSPPVI